LIALAAAEPTITLEAKAWLGVAGVPEGEELGYPHELWTTRLLARHAQRTWTRGRHAGLANLAQGTVCKILDKKRGGETA